MALSSLLDINLLSLQLQIFFPSHFLYLFCALCIILLNYMTLSVKNGLDYLTTTTKSHQIALQVLLHYSLLFTTSMPIMCICNGFNLDMSIVLDLDAREKKRVYFMHFPTNKCLSQFSIVKFCPLKRTAFECLISLMNKSIVAVFTHFSHHLYVPHSTAYAAVKSLGTVQLPPFGCCVVIRLNLHMLIPLFIHIYSPSSSMPASQTWHRLVA